jgi:large subunit ribosomal protein L17
MRHRVSGRKLSRNKDQRKALKRNLVKDLLRHERIRTTKAKAAFARSTAERMITLAKRGHASGDESRMVHARRLAAARLSDPLIVKKLFDDLAPRYAERAGGYTRMIKLGPRKGDAAEMVLLELVEE